MLLIALGGFDPALGSATPTHDGDDVEALLRVLLRGSPGRSTSPARSSGTPTRATIEQFERRVWGYGVGLTACLTKALVKHPGLIPELLRKLPTGLAFALSPRSPKNVDKPARLSRAGSPGSSSAAWPTVRSRMREAVPGAGATWGLTGMTAATRGGDGLRALIVTDSYWPLIGGANRMHRTPCRTSFRGGPHRRDRHGLAGRTRRPSKPEGDVQVHRLRDLPSRMRWISEDPYKHNPPPFPDPEAVWRLRRLIKDFEPDIDPRVRVAHPFDRRRPDSARGSRC